MATNEQHNGSPMLDYFHQMNGRDHMQNITQIHDRHLIKQDDEYPRDQRSNFFIFGDEPVSLHRVNGSTLRVNNSTNALAIGDF
jgi:hypothetical protein